MNDGYCQDSNNIPECDWDGGDCCNNEYFGWNTTCTNCTCRNPENESCPDKSLMNDNFCHDANNLPECDWDGGDCCNNQRPDWNQFCEYCQCLECPYPHTIGDSYCDDQNNILECNWDGGDCCHNENAFWNAYCDSCICLDPHQGGTLDYLKN